MSRAGEVWDNSAMESFFSSLKQARSDVLDYIERFYNLKRLHSTLGYISPIKLEKLRSMSMKPAAAHLPPPIA